MSFRPPQNNRPDPSLAASFSQEAARPLGKGYSEIMQMVISYAVEGKTTGTPTLAHSLDRIRLIPNFKQHVSGLVREPLCVIQGYSTPGNAEALIQFIQSVNQSTPQVEVVDLYDLPHLYEVLDIPMPRMRYHIADAANLGHLYQNGSVDLVVQDFLLNCIPASRHLVLMREVGRILKTGGLGLISFTSNEALSLESAVSTTKLTSQHHFGWDAQAYDLSEMERINESPGSLSFLTGQLIYNQATSEFIYVAAAGGRFEFFRAKEEMFSLFAQCGLHVRATDTTTGSDDHGLTCLRHRCILVKD